jgi:hypothetical protein
MHALQQVASESERPWVTLEANQNLIEEHEAPEKEARKRKLFQTMNMSVPLDEKDRESTYKAFLE